MNNSNSETNIFSKEEVTHVDYKALVLFVIYNWYWIVLSLIIAVGSSWLYLRYQDNLYQVSAKILIKDDKNRAFSEEAIVGGLGGAAQGSLFGGNRSLEDEIQLMTSVKLMRRIVDSLQLNEKVFVLGRVKVAELYKQQAVLKIIPLVDTDSFEQKISFTLAIRDSTSFDIINADKQVLQSGQFGLPMLVNEDKLILYLLNKNYIGSECQVEVYNPDVLAKNYTRRLKIKQVDKSNALELTFSDNIPERGIEILKRLVGAYNENNLSEKNAAGRQTLGFIDERLTFITDELYSVEKDVESYKKENKLSVDLEDQAKSILTKVTEGDKELAKIETQISILDNYRQIVQNEKNKYKPLPIPSEWVGVNAGDVIKEYNTLVNEREHYLNNAKADNPFVASMDEKFNRLRQTIITSLSTMAEELELKQRRVTKDLKPIESQISLIPKNERELLNIMRQQRIKETLFLFLLQKREETALSVAAQTANAQFLEKPLGAMLLSPKRMDTYIVAILAGFFIPLILLYIFFSLDNKIATKEDITSITQTPFLGVIGLSNRKEQLVVKQGSRSSIAEMFRLLRTNLMYIGLERKNKVLMVTSTVSGDGKSFISINLAATVSLYNKKTIILGLDLRKPRMSQYLTGKKASFGVTNYLTGDLDWRDLVQKVNGYENLYYLDSGPIPPNPAELLTSPEMIAMLTAIKEEYDFVVIDTAPIGLVADALLLKDYVDQCLVVTRFKKTTKSLLSLIEEIYRDKKLPNMSIILNAAEVTSVYGYSYGYGYGYGYGGYYDETGANNNKWWNRLISFFKKSRKKK